jgi:imidazolonepropionase-like amidohydrolase
MDTNRVLHDQTVLVEGGKIAAVGSSVSVPTDATVIDGHGSACLSPGLADMHIHTDTIEDMKLFLANGVTDDLDALEAAGLSRYEILAAATRTPGELIRRSLPGSEPFGTVAVGNRADLVLSASDPLGDLTTLRKPLGVMARGKWYSQGDLQALLDQVAKEYRDASAEAPH